MKRAAKIVLGKVDPERLKDPRVAKWHELEFLEELLKGMHEAKRAALARQEQVGISAETPVARD